MQMSSLNLYFTIPAEVSCKVRVHPALRPIDRAFLMSMTIQPTPLADYARLQAAQGTKLIEKSGIIWRRIRPMLYRPLLEFEALDSAVVEPPCSRFGAYQHVVAGSGQGNSHMNCLICDELRSYSLEGVSHNRRRLIKNAAKFFQVRPVVTARELRDKGHQVYLSFYERTGYSFKADRAHKASFDAWSETLFSCPGAFVLGAYSGTSLAAVSVSFWVRETLIYATLFAESEAQRRGVCEIMLHELRLAAARAAGISQILIRAYQGGNSRDQYYLLRGCKLVSKPARLRINPVAALLLRGFAPGAYDKLRGEISSHEISAAITNHSDGGSAQGLFGLVKAAATLGSESQKRSNL
jgi:hypothetical protein